MGKSRETHWKELLSRNFPKNNIQAEKALCSQTFSLRQLDVSTRKWKFPPLFPVSDTVHLAEMMWFSVFLPAHCCSYAAISTTKCYPPFSSSVQKGSWVASLHMETAQPKYIVKKGIILKWDKSISSVLQVQVQEGTLHPPPSLTLQEKFWVCSCLLE